MWLKMERIIFMITPKNKCTDRTTKIIKIKRKKEKKKKKTKKEEKKKRKKKKKREKEKEKEKKTRRRDFTISLSSMLAIRRGFMFVPRCQICL